MCKKKQYSCLNQNLNFNCWNCTLFKYFWLIINLFKKYLNKNHGDYYLQSCRGVFKLKKSPALNDNLSMAILLFFAQINTLRDHVLNYMLWCN